MSTMRLGFSCITGLKICHEVKFSEINLKVNYVDKQNSGRYSITWVTIGHQGSVQPLIEIHIKTESTRDL